jgi:hypothetical protein
MNSNPSQALTLFLEDIHTGTLNITITSCQLSQKVDCLDLEKKTNTYERSLECNTGWNNHVEGST